MSQEDMKQNDRGFPRMRPRDDNNTPRKGPRFSIYWVWGGLVALLIGIQLFGNLTPETVKISKLDFFNKMLMAGDVEKVDIIKNKDLVKVYLKKESIKKPYYQKLLPKTGPFSTPSE